MIKISTTQDGRRHFAVPVALADVATALFPGQEQVDAIFLMARRLLTSDFAATENIALEAGHDAAVRFAREKMVAQRR